MPPLILFIVSAALVAGAGVRLARDGDVIGHATGLGGLWVGAILVAAATSLPELATDISAVLQGQPSLAVGDLFGSTMANMLILAICVVASPGGRLLARVAVNQVLVGLIAVMLTVVAAIGILAEVRAGPLPVGLSAVAIGVGYGAGMRLLHRNRSEPPFEHQGGASDPGYSRAELRRAAIGFSVAGLVILVSAPLLASSAVGVGDMLGISTGLAGMVLLALTTSLPEAVVSAAAIRSGAHALAVGNLMGSCAFNMAAILPLDMIYRDGPLLAAVDSQLVVGALVGVLLLGLAMLDVLNKSERRRWALEPGPVVMIAVYLAGLVLTQRAGE